RHTRSKRDWSSDVCSSDLEKEVAKGVPVGKEEVHCWSWTLAITPMQMEVMRGEDRHFRIQVAVQERSKVAEDRMADLAKLVGWEIGRASCRESVGVGGLRS